MDKILITSEDINKFRPISKDINNQRLEPFIREAQFNDLRPVLGEKLFYDFMEKFDQTGDPKYEAYQKLLTGGVFEGKYFAGIIPMLVYYTLARFYVNQPINVTRFGVMNKLNEQSEPISQAAMNAAVSELRSNGLSYEHGVVNFLKANLGTYNLYENAGSSINTGGGAKFFDV
jgi:hypothetical protein